MMAMMMIMMMIKMTMMIFMTMMMIIVMIKMQHITCYGVDNYVTADEGSRKLPVAK